MRLLLSALAVSSLLVTSAFAADANKPIKNDTSPIKPYQGAQSAEPDIKAAAAKVTSSLITAAPLPDDHVMGKKDAPLTLVEYASLTCPHCAHFSNAIMPELIKKYVETGKMRYILRQFPLNEAALKATLLVDCVGENNNERYFTFNKVLFDAQRKWAYDGNYMSGLETIATVGGVSKEQFEACLNDTERETKILKAKKLANDELKIPGTPYLVLNGEIVEKERNSVEDMSKLIDEKLAGLGGKK